MSEFFGKTPKNEALLIFNIIYKNMEEKKWNKNQEKNLKSLFRQAIS